jgi:hypothetical protein
MSSVRFVSDQRTRALDALAYLEEVQEDQHVFNAMLKTPGMVPQVAFALFDLSEWLSPTALLVPGPRVASTNALQAWHDERRRGIKEQSGGWRDGRWRVDPLREAAAHEAWARDFDRMSLYESGDRCRFAAARVLTDAEKRRTAQ